MPSTLHLDPITDRQQLHPAVSSTSIITVDHSGSRDPVVRIRSASPAESASILATKTFTANAADPHEHGPAKMDMNNDRWSQSTTGSVATTGTADSRPQSSRRKAPLDQVTPDSANKPWLKRTQSPSPSTNSTRGSPNPNQAFRPPSAGGKFDDIRPGRVGGGTTSRPRSPRAASPRIERVGAPKLRLPLGDGSYRPHMSSPLSSPAPRLVASATPGPGGTPAAQVEGPDYFGLGIGAYRDGETRSQSSRATSPGPSIRSGTSSRRPRTGEPGSPSVDKSKARLKEKRDKDKKVMLSRALEKANAAVLLDNAADYQGALDAYTDACKLLLSVMERTSSEEDRRKLNAIRVTYTTRIDELQQLLQSTPISELGAEEKSASRPMSRGSESRQSGPVTHPSSPPELPQAIGVPSIQSPSQTRRVNPSRDSFLTDAIREVEGSRSSGFLGPLWEKSKSPMANGFFGEGQSSGLSKEQLLDANAPSPLTPARTVSPATVVDDSATVTDSHDLPQSGAEAMSWLNTIEESESDDGNVLHSTRAGKAVRRPLPSDQEMTSEFDAAFDAAVEAAYEDGFEPDLGHEYLSSATYGASAPVTLRPALDSRDSDANHGFDFNLNNAPPKPLRESDSSNVSHETWHSSAQTERDTTANTSYSFLTESPVHTRRKSNTIGSADYPSGFSPSKLQPPTVTERPASSGAGSGGQHLTPLTIETSLSPRRTRNTSQTSEVIVSAPSADDVTPWSIHGPPGDAGPSRRAGQRDGEEEYVYKDPNSVLSASTTSPSSASVFADDLHSPRYASSRNDNTFNYLSAAGTPNEDLPILTPNSSVFGQPSSSSSTFRRNDAALQMGSRVGTASSGHTPVSLADGGGAHLLDTSLGSVSDAHQVMPTALEPCPESPLLRPFWLLRTIQWAIINPRGGYLTNRLFLPREAWLNKSIKLKNVEDKVASCDMLTTSLSKLNAVNTYDAEAVLEELQIFEDIMERVQTTLTKKLGGEVGSSGISSLFKDAGPSAESPPDTTGRESIKSHSSKSYLSSWRKLRGKTLSGGASTLAPYNGGAKSADTAPHTMATVPMTPSSSPDKHTGHRRDALRDAIYEGPHRDYMSSIARLCEAAQSLDSIARQVEDPGLKHSSPTHVGLELSMRHASEFFGLWICRFILADIGLLIDKHVKRSTDWLLV